MKTDVMREYLSGTKGFFVRFFSVCAFCTVVFSCTNKEFNVGGDLVNGEDTETSEISFPVKAWTVPDPTADTLSGRIQSGSVFNMDNLSEKKSRIPMNFIGTYRVPGVCEVETSTAVRLQLPSNLVSFGDITIDSVDMVVTYTPVETFSPDTTIAALTGYGTATSIYKGLYPSGFTFYGLSTYNEVLMNVHRLAEEVPEAYTAVSGTGLQKKNYIPLTKKWKTAELIHSERFKINLDTIRSTVDIVDSTVVYDDEGNPIDTVYTYADSIYPRMAFRMDKQYWQNIIDHFKGQIITQKSFDSYFKGLYFSIQDGFRSPFMMLNLNQTSDVGTKKGCYVRLHFHTVYNPTAQSFDLLFSGDLNDVALAANSVQVTLDPRVKAMIENPDTINGEKELFILPFGQTEVVVDLVNEKTIKTIKDNGWTINEAYIEFSNRSYDAQVGNTPVAELWMYRYPYSSQFIYWSPTMGYPSREVSFYIPDQAVFEKEGEQWTFVNRTNHGLNGIINENAVDDFVKPGRYKMYVTRTLIDAVYGDGKPVKVGLRLPLGASEVAPNMSVLNGENLRLVVRYSKKKSDN